MQYIHATQSGGHFANGVPGTMLASRISPCYLVLKWNHSILQKLLRLWTRAASQPHMWGHAPASCTAFTAATQGLAR